MLGYPPRPTSILPKITDPKSWLVELKYRGWRAVIHQNKAYTRKGNPIPIEVNYPDIGIDYQLDGELITNDFPPTEHKVRTAIKQSNWRLEIFDIFIPSQPNMLIEDRLDFLRRYFAIEVINFILSSEQGIINLLQEVQKFGHEGLVIKRKGTPYLISTVCEIVDSNWIKIK